MNGKNIFGRNYSKGKALSEDMRELIVSDLLENGANTASCHIPRGLPTKLSSKYKVTDRTVKNIWVKYCEDGEVGRRPAAGGRDRALSDGDLELVEVLLKEKPTISYAEISTKLQQYSALPCPLSKQRISDAVRKYLPSGKMTFKKVSRQSGDRYTQRNLNYTQDFITYASRANPQKLKFFDESGFKVTVCHRNYGHSKVGEPCIEIGRYVENRNLTLNLLVSLSGVCYFNFLDGPSNTQSYIQFWEEAAESVNENATSALEPGDIVIIDNCPIHRNNGELVVSNFLDRMGIEYMFLPTYSPDLNPVESCFSQIKSILKQERFAGMAVANLKVAIGEAIKEISVDNIAGYYRATGYINV